jgi:hypothetical protein
MSKRSGGSLKKTGWHKQAFMAQPGRLVDPIVPTAWEELLRALEIEDEAEALRQVSLATATGHKLRTWVQERFRARFVPEDVLRALDLLQAVERDGLVVTEEYRQRISEGAKAAHLRKRTARAAARRKALAELREAAVEA